MVRFLLAAGALAALAACASPSRKTPSELTPDERTRMLLTPADRQRGDVCTVGLGAPPAFGELTDSTAVLEALGRHREASGRIRGTALLTIDVDSTGTPEWIGVLDTDRDPTPRSS